MNNYLLSRNSHKLYIISLLLVVITMPYAYAVNSTAIFILAAIWIIDLNWRLKWYQLKKNPIAWIFIGLYVLEAIGLIYTQNLASGLFALQKKVLLLALPILLATQLPLSPAQIKLLFAAFVGTCLLGCLICLSGGLYYGLVYNDYHYLFYHELAAFIGMQGIYLSIYTGVSILIVVYYLFYEARHISTALRLLGAVIVIFLIIFTILLSIRTTLAALFLLLTGILLHYFILNKRLITGLLAIFIMLALASSLIYLNPVSKQKFLEAFNTQETIQLDTDGSLGRDWGGKALRIAIWQCAMDVISDHSLLGVGTGDGQDALQKSYKNRKFNFAFQYNTYNAHNQYLETWISLGMVGLFILLASLIVPLCLALRNKQYFYMALFLFFAVSFLTESVLERQKGVLIYAFFNALYALHGKHVSYY